MSLCILGVALMVWATSNRTENVDDFRSFYRAGSLLAHHESVYSHPSSQPGSQTDTDFLPYVRIPSYALVFEPLATLSYPTARRIWLLVGLLTLICAIWLAPARRREMALATAFSMPVAYAFLLGQDIFLVLFGVILALRVWTAGREFAAGLVLSVIGIKVSYLPAVGLACLAKSRRATLGLITGMAAQIGISFAVEGWRWPGEMLKVLTDPRFDLEPRRMLNIRALTTASDLPSITHLVAALILLGLFWMLSKRLAFTDALLLALPIGLIASPHCYIYDAVVLIPLLSTAASLTDWKGAFALIALTPVPYLALMSNLPSRLSMGTALIVFAVLVVFVSLWKHTGTRHKTEAALPQVVFNPPPVLN